MLFFQGKIAFGGIKMRHFQGKIAFGGIKMRHFRGKIAFGGIKMRHFQGKIAFGGINGKPGTVRKNVKMFKIRSKPRMPNTELRVGNLHPSVPNAGMNISVFSVYSR